MGEVVVGKIDFSDNFWRFLLFWCIFILHCGSVFGDFSDIFGIRWDFLAIYFANFGAILTIFDHFWAIFGSFLGRKKKWLFFAEKWHFGPGIGPAGQNHRWGKSV